MQLISKFTRTIIPPKYLHEPYNFKLGGFLLLMQEQERKTKLLKGMLLTFATLTYFNEFLQKSSKLMSSSFKFQVLLFVFPKLYNSLSMVTWFVFLDIILPRTLRFYLIWRNKEEMKKMGEKWSPSYFLLLKRTWDVFKGGEGVLFYIKLPKCPY